MSLILDSSGVYALYDADDRFHQSACAVIERERGSLILPSAILSEIDYLMREFLGIDAELDFLQGVRAGAYLIEPFTAADLERCSELIERYRGLDLGLADAAVIATAERLNIRRILTVDERDFRAVTPLHGALTLLPADTE